MPHADAHVLRQLHDDEQHHRRIAKAARHIGMKDDLRLGVFFAHALGKGANALRDARNAAHRVLDAHLRIFDVFEYL